MKTNQRTYRENIFKATGGALAAAAFLLGVNLLGESHAQSNTAPTMITFQGRLTDNLNNPLGGSHNFIFKIFDNSTGAGTALWTETQNGVTVTNGALGVQLGAVTALSTTVFAGATTYLQITVDGTALSPLEQLVSVPYAMNSLMFAGRDYTGFISTDTATQIAAGTKTFSGAIYVPTPSSAGQAANKAYVDSFTGGGTSVLKAGDSMTGPLTMVSGATITISGSRFSVGGSTLAVAGGFVGVGTSAPDALLHVAGQVKITGGVPGAGKVLTSDVNGLASWSNAAAGDVTLVGTQTFSGANTFVSSFTARSGGREIILSTSATAGVASVYVSTYGSVGIGTTNLYSELDVRGELTIQNNVNPSSYELSFLGTGGTDIRSSNEMLFRPVGYLALWPGNAEAMRLTTTGNVGIGTTAPSTKFEVNGDAQFGSGVNKSTFSAAGALFMNSGSSITLSGADGFITGASSVNASAFFGSGAALTGIPSTASIAGTYVAKTGDGMSGPLTMLSGSTITVSGNAFSVGGSTLVVSGGSVGVGTTSPGAPLHVVGTELRLGGAVAPRFSLYHSDGTTLYSQYAIATAANHFLTGSAQGDTILAGQTSNSKIHFGQITNDNLVMTVDGENERVGISTTAPMSKLHIHDGDIRISTTVGAASKGIYFQDGSLQTTAFSAGSFVQKTGDAMTGPLTMLSGSTITISGNAFSVGGSTLVVASGNIGIGTSAPGAKLDVNGVIRGDISTFSEPINAGTTDAGGDKFIIWESLTPYRTALGMSGGGLYIQNTGGNAATDGIRFFTGASIATEVMRIGRDGYVGIGTAVPVAKLHMSSGTLLIDGDAATAFKIGTSSLVVTSAGNVGIATTFPVASLDVNGNAQFGFGINKSTFSAEGGLFMNSGSSITLSGSNGYITGASSINASAFFGSGAALTGIPSTASIAGTYVAKTGDGMSGPLTMLSGSTITVSGNAFSVGASTFAVTGGKVGIGTSIPNIQVSVVGASTGEFGVSGGGGKQFAIYSGAGDATIYADTSSAAEGRTLHFARHGTGGGTMATFKNDGRVGVGTTVPAARLHVSSASAAATDVVFQISSGTSAGQELLSVKGDGLVGIGTTNPELKLSIVNKSIGALGVGYQGTGSNRLMFGAEYNGTAVAEADVAFIGYGPTTSVGSNRLIAFGAYTGAAWAEIMRLNSNGNVAIGTTNPASKLHVLDGDIRVSTSVGQASKGIYFQDGTLQTTAFSGAGTFVQKIGDAMTGPLTMQSGSTITVSGNAFSVGDSTFVVAGGKVGIGTTNPSSALHVLSALSPMLVLSSGTAASQEVLRVGSNGYIGIGTTNPAFQLTIASPYASVHAKTTSINQPSQFLLGNTTDDYAAQIWLNPSNPSSQAYGPAGTLNFYNKLASMYFNTNSVIAAVVITQPGLVGISTSAPTSKLHVHDGDIRISTTVGAASKGIYFQDGTLQTTAFGAGSFVQKTGDAMTGPLTMQSGSTITVSGNAFSVGDSTFVVTGGKVGVGTTAPSYSLSVVGSANGLGVAQFRNGGTLPYTWLSDDNGGSNNSYFAHRITNNYHLLVVNKNGGGTQRKFGITMGGADLDVNVKFAIDTSGNVGIATGAPQGLFDVGGGNLVVQTGGQVGVGTTAPAARLHVSSASALSTDTILQVSSGTGAGQELMVVKGDGKVGVGTSNPAYLLQVRGAPVGGAPTVSVQSNSPANTSYSAIVPMNSAGNGMYLTVGDANYSASYYAKALWGTIAGTSGVNLRFGANTRSDDMVIDGSGNIGISTSVPLSKLHVHDGDIRISTTAGAASKGLYFQDGTLQTTAFSGAGSFVLKAGDGMTGPLTMLSGATITVSGNAFSVGGSTLVVAGGSVGIGTTAPTTKLEVNGDAQFGAGATKSTFTSTGDLQVQGTMVSKSSGAIGGRLMVGTAGTGDAVARLDVYSLTELQILARGWAPISANPSSGVIELGASASFRGRLQYDGANAHLYLDNTYDNSDGNIYFRTRAGSVNTSTFTILGSGSVGIGTTAPSATLHVSSAPTSGNSVLFQVGGGTIAALGSGNVGIGTTNPGGKLHISDELADDTTAALRVQGYWGNSGNNADVYFSGNLAGGGANRVLFKLEDTNPAAGGPWGSLIRAFGDIEGDGSAGSSDVVFDVSSNGNSSFTGKLDIRSYTAPTASGLTVSSQNAAGMFVVRGDGNVGVATTAPAARLHVVAPITDANALIIATGTAVSEQILRVSTDGIVFAAKGFTYGADLAEMYPSEEPAEPGDVMAVSPASGADDSKPLVLKATAGRREALMGVVSTNPGTTLGWNRIDQNEQRGHVALGLAGRIPVKVTAENGTVRPGDFLTVSSIRPGYAAKAVTSGMVVGMALEAMKDGAAEGKVMTFVNLQNWVAPGEFESLREEIRSLRKMMRDGGR